MRGHPFVDRADAGRRLATALADFRGDHPVVLGLPRGGVPVAYQVARALEAPLDVIIVRKLGVPFQPELAMGAVGEEGVVVEDPTIIRAAGVERVELHQVEERERAEVDRRAERFRGGRAPLPVVGRTVLVVDDGLATGSTATAACRVARARGATRIVLAVPVGAPETVERLSRVADRVVCLEQPTPFLAVGRWYVDFSQTPDSDVVELLERAAGGVGVGAGPPGAPDAGPDPGDPDCDPDPDPGDPDGDPDPDPVADPDGDPDPDPVADPDPAGSGRAPATEVMVPVPGARLEGRLTVPPGAAGVVIFVHGSGSSRHSPRNRSVADSLNRRGLGTLLFDLLTPDEEVTRAHVFDIELLGTRLVAATRWLREQPAVRGAAVGYFGASTGGGAALWAAGAPGADVRAVVSRGGRPDLAGDRLGSVHAPTLLVVGGADPVVMELNLRAARELRCPHRLAVVPNATHLFEEPGALEAVASLAGEWFSRYFGTPDGNGHHGPGDATGRGDRVGPE